MAMSLWVSTAKVIVSVEALLGVGLNTVLLVFLWRSDIDKEGRIYRISCMITSILGFCTTFLLFLLQDVVLLVDGCLAVVLYGPVLFYLPDKANDILAVWFFTHVHTMWQTLSAPSIVQWMCLARPNSTSSQKLLCAYSIPLLLYANTLYYMRYLLPDQSLRAELERKIYDLHGTTSQDFHIYGFRMFDEKTIDLRDVMLREAFPSYILTYGLFTFSAFQIKSRLHGWGSVASTKTALMQRRFFRIQIAQGFLPLALLSPPMGIALIAALHGVNFANLSFILVYTLWLSPSATAFLLLLFVSKSARSRMSSKMSVSKISPKPRAFV